MWPDGEGSGPSSRPERVSSGSEVVVIGDQLPIPSSDMPSIGSMNIHRSKVDHIGPKFVTVTQNVHTNEVIKGRFLGLELVSPKHSRRLRCSVAVFVCWAFVIAGAVAIYLLKFAIFAGSKIDLDIPFHRYLFDLAKNSTKAERILCTVSILLVVVCAVLIAYFIITKNKTTNEETDTAPHEWYITREMWLAEPYNNTLIEKQYEPLRLVIIQHTTNGDCHIFNKCAIEIRNLQTYFINDLDRDIPYNFIIGNDGRVYEGRGWRFEGAHTRGFNKCSLGIGFMGDYRDEKSGHSTVTAAQQNRTHMLLEKGVRLGYLDLNYFVVGAKDLHKDSKSPGTNLYNAIKQWKHYDHENRFYNRTCTEINSQFLKE